MNTLATVPTAVISEASNASQNIFEIGLRGSLATEQAYKKDFEQFKSYCETFGTSEISEALIMNYLTFMSGSTIGYEWRTDKPYKLASLMRKLASIRKMIELSGIDSTMTYSKQFGTYLKGLSKVVGKAQNITKSVQSKEDFFKLLTAATKPIIVKNAKRKRTHQPIDLTTVKGHRDYTLLLIGFYGAYRRSELASLKIENLEFTKQGVILSQFQSKTNQAGQRETKFIPYSKDDRYCAVTYLERLIGTKKHGYVFTEGTGKIADEYVYTLAKRVLGKNFTAHSLRGSFITCSKKAGADDRSIMNQTKHKNSAILHRYYQNTEIQEHNAVSFLA